ncbi:MAG: HlyD family efflux transporter periplasmic adaptor subunit [Oscillospiraceae bacterium]|jgi:multidrug efflux pump subunit AcrA (membrane-fusion protein)|nr:HlyD family efflux transporter periplasmic adaptor subunit [Oscillospiraceae bacterium]
METPVAKRGWVKNAAIIFLVILLALTFFSNTIMNATLPEVTTAAVNAGTISAQIRVQGVITPNETYEVKVNQTLKVESVFVKAGVTVITGDPLFTLSGDVSEELKAAEAAVDAAEVAYQDAMLAVDGYWMSDALLEIERQEEEITALEEKKKKAVFDAAASAGQDKAAELEALKRALSDAKLALADAIRNTTREQARYDEKYAKYLADNKDALADYTKKKAAYDTEKAAYDKLTKAVKDAELKSRDLERDVDALTDEVARLTAALPAKPAEPARDANTIQSEMSAARIKHDAANQRMQAAQSVVESAQARLDAAISADPPDNFEINQAGSQLQTASTQLDTAAKDWSAAAETLRVLSEELSKLTNYDKEKAAYENAMVGVDAAKKKLASAAALQKDGGYALADAKTAVSDAFPKGEPVKPTEPDELNKPDNSALESVILAQEKAQDAVDNAQYKLDNPSGSNGGGVNNDFSSYDDAIRAAEKKLEDLHIALEKKQTDKTESVKLQRLLKSYNKAKSELLELQTEGAISQFTAPVDGLVKSVTVTPGNDTKPGDIAVSIEMPERGYYLSAKINNEQAQLLTPGMEAENENNWWGPSIRAVLGVIRPDPENPRTSKELIFDVSGETVNSGDSLSLAIGGRGNQYNLVVPKSAVRSDNNGDFVLMLTEKQTPLGSRYVATRVEVQVAESDDNNSAITGALRQYQDFVITASTSDVSPGQYVRLSGS